MKLFVVGDVHGCFQTFRSLLSRWNHETEILVQVGDLIDRGNFNPQTIQLCRELQTKYGAIFLKGNHEQLALDYFRKKKTERWYEKYGKKVLWQYTLEDIDPEDDFDWIETFPTFLETENVFLSHAGIDYSSFSMDECHADGLFWNRGHIKNIGKLQVFGHTPLKSGKPEFDEESNSWNIDTGAYRGKALSALRINEQGKVAETIVVPTFQDDIM